MKDETFRAFLSDPDFLLSILPISRELNRILKRIFCIDPKRRITINELKEKIRNCKYFTRTAEVDRWEQTAMQQQFIKRQNKKSVIVELPPSPPTTPDRSRSTSPAIWQQRIDNNNEKQQVIITNTNNNNNDSILTTMLTTLVV